MYGQHFVLVANLLTIWSIVVYGPTCDRRTVHVNQSRSSYLGRQLFQQSLFTKNLVILDCYPMQMTLALLIVVDILVPLYAVILEI